MGLGLTPLINFVKAELHNGILKQDIMTNIYGYKRIIAMKIQVKTILKRFSLEGKA